MSSDSNSDSSVHETPKKKKKLAYRQKYIKSWESDERFKGWLTRSKKGDYFFHCIACNCDNKCGITELERHRSGQKHISHVKSRVKQHTLFTLPSTSRQTDLETKAKEGELRIASFVVEHNIPINVSTHLTKLIKAVCPDSEIAKKTSCGRTKCGELIKNVIGEESRENLCKMLRDNKFSLIADESTDVSNIKHLTLVTRVTMPNFEIRDMFFALVPLKDATATSLHCCIKKAFEEERIPYKDNLIGFAADGANVMLGAHNSLSALLKNEIPGLFIMKCICHSFHLCASYACLKLPRGLEDLARDVYNYFKSSPKRVSELKEYQSFVQVEPHKILHPSQTRWLSLLEVVNRLLEQLAALKLYFTNAAITDRILAAESILNKLQDPSTQLYLEFLQFILPVFTNLNREMQSEHPKIHTLYDRVSVAFRTIVDCYLKPDYVNKTEVCNLEYRNPRNFLPLEEIYLGGKVTAAIYTKKSGLNENDLMAFRVKCLDFLIEGAQQICKRFPFKETPLKSMHLIAPSHLLDVSSRMPSVVPLASLLPGVISSNEMNDIDREWRQLRNETFDVEADIDVCAFWKMVCNIKHGDGTVMYPLLSRLVKGVGLLCLSHSSAAVERTFSAINLMKTKQRNRLEVKIIVGLLHSKRHVAESSCYKIPVTRYVPKMKLAMYDFKKTGDTDSDSE